MVRTDVALGVRFDGAGARNAHSETDTTPVTAVTPRATTTTLDARVIPAAFAATVAEASSGRTEIVHDQRLPSSRA